MAIAVLGADGTLACNECYKRLGFPHIAGRLISCPAHVDKHAANAALGPIVGAHLERVSEYVWRMSSARSVSLHIGMDVCVVTSDKGSEHYRGSDGLMFAISAAFELATGKR